MTLTFGLRRKSSAFSLLGVAVGPQVEVIAAVCRAVVVGDIQRQIVFSIHLHTLWKDRLVLFVVLEVSVLSQQVDFQFCAQSHAQPDQVSRLKLSAT